LFSIIIRVFEKKTHKPKYITDKWWYMMGHRVILHLYYINYININTYIDWRDCGQRWYVVRRDFVTNKLRCDIIILLWKRRTVINYSKTPRPTGAHTFGKTEVVGVIVLFFFQFYYHRINSNVFGRGWRENLLRGRGHRVPGQSVLNASRANLMFCTHPQFFLHKSSTTNTTLGDELPRPRWSSRRISADIDPPSRSNTDR